MPKLTIDGKEIEVPKGTRLIEAAKLAGSAVPFYCYHPGLSIAGNCRMCLVEVENMPKLQISCHIEAKDDMVVKTKSDRVLNTRKHVLEFLLVNHPVDCPVCDQAGECWLQDYYLRHGAYDSRLNEDKVKKKKATPVGKHVMLDAERCILCSRCVRFCDEVSKTSEFGIINRGDHAEITVFPETEVNNPYSGNVVDICPVGALTDRDFRFKLRVWYLSSEATLCTGCSRGCNIDMQYRAQRPHHSHGERIMRLKPRYNPEVNKWWICDEGRYGYKFHDQNRILSPLKRIQGEVLEQDWDHIISDVEAMIARSKEKIAVFVSPSLSNEEIFLIKKLFKENLKVEDLLLVSQNPDGFQDDFLIQADKHPNREGAKRQGLTESEEAIKQVFQNVVKGNIEGLIFFGQDVLTLFESLGAEEALKAAKWSAFIGSNHNLTAESVNYVLPSATYAEKEGTYTNCDGRVQKFNQVVPPIQGARSEMEILKFLARRLEVDFPYEFTEEVFEALVMSTPGFKDLVYEQLTASDHHIGIFSAPMIPTYMQQADLIFEQGTTYPPELEKA